MLLARIITLSPISLEKETIQNLILAFLCYCVIIIPNSLANILRTFVNSCISSRIPFSELLSLVVFNNSCFSCIIRLMKVAIYPGSFDPITFGHIDIVDRATSLFDQVIIGVAESRSKEPLFSTDERIELVKETFKDNNKINVIGYSKKLTVDLARENNAIAIIRGLRAVADFEYEFQLATMNRSLAPDIESIFFTPKDTLIYVSSSLVKEIAQFGGNVERFVPKHIVSALDKKFS